MRLLAIFLFVVVSVTTYAQTSPERPVTSTAAQSQPAEFPGGSERLSQYLAKRLRYPRSLLKAGIYPPQIAVSFLVTKTGEVQHVEVANMRQADQTRYEAYLANVVNVIEKMPRWTPGRLNNVPIDTRHVIPVDIVVRTGGRAKSR